MANLVGILFLTAIAIAKPATDADRAKFVGDLQSPDAAIRAKAIKAMWPVNDKARFKPLTPALRAALNTLIESLHDKDQIVRAGAVQLLGAAGDPGAVEALAAAALKDRDWIVRRDACIALGDIGDLRASLRSLRSSRAIRSKSSASRHQPTQRKRLVNRSS